MEKTGHGVAGHVQVIEEAARLVDEGLSVTLPVNGRSMLPFIVGGRDSVILSAPPAIPKAGDVVLAWVDGCRYVLHRITLTDGDRVTLMGDGNLKGVEHCSVADIRAIATHVVRPGRKPRHLYTPWRKSMARLWLLLLPIRRYLLKLTVAMHNS